jgi:hypothetical protein
MGYLFFFFDEIVQESSLCKIFDFARTGTICEPASLTLKF